MLTTQRTKYLGRYFTAEGSLEVVPRVYKHDGTLPLVLYCHGAGGSSNNPGNALSTEGEFRFVEEMGRYWPVLACDLGGASTWGNQTARDRIIDAINYGQRPWPEGLGARGGKVVMTGISMGGCNSYSFAQAHPELVAGIVAGIPVSDLNDIRNFNRPDAVTNFRDWINGAYGLPAGSTSDYPVHGTSLALLPTGYNPAQYHDQVVGHGIPAQVWYCSDDPICTPATVLLLAGQLGAEVHPLGALGHSNAAVLAMDHDEVNRFITDLDFDGHAWTDYAALTWNGLGSAQTWRAVS